MSPAAMPQQPFVAMPAQAGVQAGPEQTIWRGTPSAALLFGKIVRLVIAAIGLPLLLVYGYDWLLDARHSLSDKDPKVMSAGWIIIAAILLYKVGALLFELARIKSTIYTLTNQRINIESGLTTKSVQDIDLRYIDDTEFFQGLYDRLLGIGNVTVVSSDKEAPRFVMRGIKDPRTVRELIRSHAYASSQRQFFTRST